MSENEGLSWALVVVFLLFIGVVLYFGLVRIMGNEAETAYIIPCSNQYCVMVRTQGMDSRVSKPLPLPKAAQVADEYNRLLWNKEYK